VCDTRGNAWSGDYSVDCMTALAGQMAEAVAGGWRLVVWEEGRNSEMQRA